jgi:hypothetical protein
VEGEGLGVARDRVEERDPTEDRGVGSRGFRQDRGRVRVGRNRQQETKSSDHPGFHP